jgi:hypothetical protein
MTGLAAFARRHVRSRLGVIAMLAALLATGIAIGQSYGRDVIEIDQAAIDFRIREIERGRGTRLSPPEREQAASAYIDEHVLARVAARRGFDDDDRIRGILSQKMLQLLASSAPDPTDEELRAYYARHQARYATSESMTAEHWIAADGAHEKRSVLERVTPTELAFTFGDRVAAEAASAALGAEVALAGGSPAREWLVIVARFAAGTPPPFESIRHHVRYDWRAERDEALLKSRVAELRNDYEVRLVPAPTR